MKAGIYLGFPGIGKTPMARDEPNVVDLDAGLLRRSLAQVAQLPESDIDEHELARFIAVLANNLVSEGWAVITNLPLVMHYAKVAKVFVPSSAAGIRSAASKLGVEPSNVQTYIEEWSLAAKAGNVPVVKLRKGIDFIFRMHRRERDAIKTPVLVEQQDDDHEERKMGEFW
jgi:hypothetical protein